MKSSKLDKRGKERFQSSSQTGEYLLDLSDGVLGSVQDYAPAGSN